MRVRLITVAAVLIASCGSREDPAETPPNTTAAEARSPSRTSERASSSGTRNDSTDRWDLQSSSVGVALALLHGEESAIRLFCPAGQNRLLVDVRAFRRIGSEERLALGGRGNVATLVADTLRDARGGGVSGTGEVPDNLPTLLKGEISASYGAQTSGPYPMPPQNLTRAFVAACGERSATGTTNACLMQENDRLGVTPLKAVGTEPFWAARIDGRCVRYSHPEDPDGTRVWTRYTATPSGGTWVGALGGQRFELRTYAVPSCSDGMSDKRYPLAVELTVHGERRSGCAEPI